MRIMRNNRRDNRKITVAIGPTFASLVAESFEQIQDSGTGNVAIAMPLDSFRLPLGIPTTERSMYGL